MAPLFFAFDQNIHKELVPYHLADINKFPKKIQECFEQGGFTVSLSGRPWSSNGLDEAHEMCVNKDLKSAVVRPTTQYLQKTSLFFNYRISCNKNFMQQIFTQKESSDGMSKIYQKHAENINRMYGYITEHKMLFGTGDCILNPFTKQEATPHQTRDMLNFRAIGDEAYINYVTFRIVSQPSTNSTVPIRNLKVCTMAPPKFVSKRKMNEKERELKDVTRYLRRKLEWCRQTGQANEQYSVFPRALCDNQGTPYSGPKAHG